MLVGSSTGIGELGCLEISLVYLDSQGTLDEVDGKDKSASVFSATDDSFQSLERSATHAYLSSHTKVRVRFDLCATGKSISERLNFFFWEDGGLAIKGDEPHDPRHFQHLQLV